QEQILRTKCISYGAIFRALVGVGEQGSDSSLKTMNTKKKQPLLFMRFQYDDIRIRDKSMIVALRLRENQPSLLNDKAREKATLDWQAFTIEDRFKRLYIDTCNNIYIHPRQG
uniref:Uncharacterized protein n=1 Tax=Echinococcus canadensis TaxID=519352 RepID=A0A915EZ53_9CEST